MDEKVIEVILNIKEAVHRVEKQNVVLFEQAKEIKKDLEAHDQRTKKTNEIVQKHAEEIAEAKTILKTLKWVIGFVAVTLPAIAAKVLKLI